MASDYQEITKYNEKQLGLDTASRRTQICMYSDSTHFIYEILQNADDYEATEVIFKLSKDQLLIEHNGTPFNEENVRAITYFGKSTSRESLVKTGRFGVGFKSVFAITSTPTIVSGNEHFQIYDLYRIREHEYPVGFSRQRTRITLPFNHETQKPDYVEKFMSREDAYLKLSSRITELNMNALLFTQNVREIRWEIDDGSGHYLRKDTIDGEARITTIINEEQEQHYLVFSRVPEWRGRKYKAVEIAFAMDKDKRITSTEDYLYVLFPTKEETHLKFLLNGPYRTNPARETISEDDSFNKHLIKETSALMKDVIFHIKEMTLLTIQFLGILPNNGDGLKNFYSPILNEIARTFHQQKLIQTDDGCYASASDVLLGPAAIREVITRNELQFFTERENACWAKGVQQNSRADQFLRSLDIETWSWKQLEKVLEYKYWISDDRNRWGNLWNGTEEDNEWIAGRNARWLQNFYILLADGVRTSDLYAYTITRCQIIRTLERGKIKHVVAKDAYFPKKGYSDLPRIKPEILQGKTQQRTEKVEESLIVLGVSKIGSRERIDYLINTYYDDEEMLLLVNKKQHLQHMKSFIKRWKENQNTDIFNEATIFLTREINDYRVPGECYIDTPLKKSGLNAIYSNHLPNIPSKYLLWGGYRKLSSEGFYEFSIACGVTTELEIEHQQCHYHPQWSNMSRGKRTNRVIDDDYNISNLSELLNHKSRKVNLLIWNLIAKADPKVLEAVYQPNKQSDIERYKSSLVLKLSNAEWIPDKRGHLYKPCDITKRNLHRDFRYDNRNGWLDEVGLGENDRKASEENIKSRQMVLSLGLPEELADYASVLKTDEERDKFNQEIKELVKRSKAERRRVSRSQQQDVPYFDALAGAFFETRDASSPDIDGLKGDTTNHSGRREKVSDEIAIAIENEGKTEARSWFVMRKKWKGKNDQVRINLAEWYNGKCQICGSTFKQKNGENYFEGVYLVRYTMSEWIDRVGNVLCVCPLHSAMFQYGPKEADNIIQQIMELQVEAEGGDGHPAIRMKLCDEPIIIEFSEKHLIDLQEMINASKVTAK